MKNESQTKICKHCQTEIPKKAKVCPQCRKKQGGGCLPVVIGFFVLILIVGLFSGGDESTPSDDNPQSVGKIENNDNAENNDEKIDNEFVVGEIVETSSLKISYLSAGEYKSDNEFMQPEEGYTYWRTEFEIENISDTDQAISSMMSWECYADDYSMEQSWVGDDVIDATLSPGKKVKGAMYFIVPVDAEEIIVEFETNFWSETKVIFVAK